MTGQLSEIVNHSKCYWY